MRETYWLGLWAKIVARIGWAWRIILCSFSSASVRVWTRNSIFASHPLVLSLLAAAMVVGSASGSDARRRVLGVDRAVMTTRAVLPTNVIGATVKTDGTNGFVALRRSDYQVLIGRGTNLTPVKGAVTNVNGKSFAQVPVGIPYYVLPPDVAPHSAARIPLWPLKWECSRGVAATFTGRLILAQDALFDYDPDSNDFRTTLRVGWETQHRSEKRELLPVHVRLNTGVFKHDTNYVAIEQPGIPGEKEVSLSASSAYSQRAVKARSSDKNGYSLPEVELVIEAEPRSLWSLFSMLVPGPHVGRAVHRRHARFAGAIPADLSP